jgi:hypothetical protein
MTMRRSVGVAVAVFSAAALGTIPAQAQVATQDSATGTFTLAGFSAPLTLDAHSGPSGENPGGTFVPPGAGVWSVACLRVRGSTAVIGVNGPGVQGPVSDLIQVVDAPIDTLAASSTPGPVGADSCGIPPVTTPWPITSGDIVVVDAQPSRARRISARTAVGATTATRSETKVSASRLSSAARSHSADLANIPLIATS